MPRINHSDPIYVSDDEFSAICEATGDEFMSRVFEFYRVTGCRSSEPFYAEINGRFMTIPAEHAKGRRARDIELNKEEIEVLRKMQNQFHTPEKSGSYKHGWKRVSQTHEIGFISKAFLSACRKAGIEGKKFHSLRHTCAVRTYLETRDIYAVSRKLGHASVTVTEIYARFDTRRLEQDFPTVLNPRKKKKQLHIA